MPAGFDPVLPHPVAPLTAGKIAIKEADLLAWIESHRHEAVGRKTAEPPPRPVGKFTLLPPPT
jgi:hypothetical protein